MKKRMRTNLVLGVACLGMLTLSGTTLYAVDISMDASVTLQSAGTAVKTNDIEFGTVTVDPDDATLRIDANPSTNNSVSSTSATRATPTDQGTLKRSSFTGTSGSGLITVTSPISVLVSVDADDTATLAGASGQTLSLSSIPTYSTGTYTHAAGGFADTPSYVHIGGEIIIGTTSNYPPEEYNTTNTGGSPFNVSVTFE